MKEFSPFLVAPKHLYVRSPPKAMNANSHLKEVDNETPQKGESPA
jgi:hypothetical protein